RPLGRKPIQLPDDVTRWPTVDVFIPTYNEPLDIVKATVMAAVNMDYPPDKFQVYILDDGRREVFRQFAEEYGVAHVTRNNNFHAKAGNINAALEHTDRELVAIFDCDHVPTRSFLQLSVGWFLTDSKLGMVQTPHHFYSPDPFEKNLDIFKEVPNESSLFYGIVQDGNDLWNATFFCGSCAVIRREALAEIGGVAVETVTEDAHTSLRMQRKGWNTAYLNIPQAAGLATASIADHIGQRIRWARGMVQILRVDNPLFGSGLKLPQRLCYFNSMVHYLYAAPRLIFLTAPLVYLLLGLSNMYGSVITILAYALPHLALATLTNSRVQGKHRHSFWNEVYETVLAPYILFPTTAALINPKWGKFNVTSKNVTSERTYLDWNVATPFAILIGLNLLGVGFGVTKVMKDWDQLPTIGINVFWSSLNIVVLGASVAAAIEKKQLRVSIRIPAVLPVECEFETGEVVQTTTINISTGGAAVKMERTAGVRVADLATLRFAMRGEEVPIPVVVTEVVDNVVRVAFQRLTLQQEERVALLVFSGADFWNRWRMTGEDRPLYSFLRILEISMRGLIAIPASFFGSIAEASKSATPIASRRPVFLALLLAAILLALLSVRASGQVIPPVPAASPGANQPFHSSVSFREAGKIEGVELPGRDAVASLWFPVPMTKLATEAQLMLRYRLAPALHAEGSQLEVSLNGSPVGSIPLRSGGSETATATLLLPSELLTTGNQLSFHIVAQCDDCTPKDARRLITTLEATSEIRYSGVVLPLPNSLELLPQPFFDPSSSGMTQVGFYFPTSPDRSSLTAAATLASWFGMQAESLATEFRVSVTDLPPGNAVVVADRSRGDLSGLSCDVPDGMAVTICSHPTDPSSKLLVVSGNSPAEILAAARAFVVAKGLRGRSAALRASNAPPRPDYDAPRWLRAGESVSFREFSSPGQLSVVGPGSAKLYFRLAPDLHYSTRSMVALRVAFRWKKLPDALSAKVSVMLNGILVARRSFRGDSTADIIRQTLQVPVLALYPRNTLTFEVDYPQLPSGSRPVFELQPDSSLDLRGVGHFTEMPRLDLFAKAGFPFTRKADLSETAIVLPPSPTAEQIALALSATAFLSSQTGVPATLVLFLNPAEVDRTRGKDLLVIGAGQDQSYLRAQTAGMPVVFQDGAWRANEPHYLLHRMPALPWVGYEKERRAIREFLNTPHQRVKDDGR
ncbi:MAG: UDP-forming cellulose synthase catalytic subunit, partial [Bryobacteraceae bacterium]